MFESRAAGASTKASGVLSGTGGRDSERKPDCGSGVVSDTVCVGVQGTCVGPEADAEPEDGDG